MGLRVPPAPRLIRRRIPYHPPSLPDSRQLAYTALNDAKIHICKILANVIAYIESVFFPHTSIIYMLILLQTSKSEHPDILNVRDPALSFLHTIPFFICDVAAFAKFHVR